VAISVPAGPAFKDPVYTKAIFLLIIPICYGMILLVVDFISIMIQVGLMPVQEQLVLPVHRAPVAQVERMEHRGQVVLPERMELEARKDQVV
jgi:hypothetical protein